MSELKERKFKDVFRENFSKEQRREVAKVAFKWLLGTPHKFVKEKSKIALLNIKKFGKAFVKSLKSISSKMEAKLKDAKISEYFKKPSKEDEK